MIKVTMEYIDEEDDRVTNSGSFTDTDEHGNSSRFGSLLYSLIKQIFGSSNYEVYPRIVAATMLSYEGGSTVNDDSNYSKSANKLNLAADEFLRHATTEME